ncbi:MAG: MAPEG family protein [Endozoicomonas sp.]
MDTVLWCLAILMILPYLLSFYGGYYRKKNTGEIDNHNPRQQVSQLDDYGQRIYAAQHNCWEALILFTASIVVVYLSGVDLTEITVAALVFTAARLSYIAGYLSGFAMFRSLAFMVGLGAAVYIVSRGLA